MKKNLDCKTKADAFLLRDNTTGDLALCCRFSNDKIIPHAAHARPEDQAMCTALLPFIPAVSKAQLVAHVIR
jgi:hypothetical protein